MQHPGTVAEIWRQEFLGTLEWGGLFDLTGHPQVIGHPSRLLALRDLIRFMKRQDGAWWATAHDVARHWLARSAP